MEYGDIPITAEEGREPGRAVVRDGHYFNFGGLVHGADYPRVSAREESAREVRRGRGTRMDVGCSSRGSPGFNWGFVSAFFRC